MAYRLALHYIPGDTRLHRWDARGKLLAMAVATASLLQVRPDLLAVHSVLLICALRVSKLPVRVLLEDLKGWLAMLLVIFLMHTLFASAPPPDSVGWASASYAGMIQGILVCWRLTLLLGFSVVFSAVTSPRELRQAIIWLLRPFVFLPLRRIGFMAGLSMRLLPLVLDELQEVIQAQKARLGDRGRRPLRRAKYLTLPLLRRSLRRADDLACALAARGYREDLPLELSKMPWWQLIPILLFIIFWLAMAHIDLPGFAGMLTIGGR